MAHSVAILIAANRIADRSCGVRILPTAVPSAHLISLGITPPSIRRRHLACSAVLPGSRSFSSKPSGVMRSVKSLSFRFLRGPQGSRNVSFFECVLTFRHTPLSLGRKVARFALFPIRLLYKTYL